MKAFRISCALLGAICLFVFLHSVTMIKLAHSIDALCKETENYAMHDKWDKVSETLDTIRSIWDKKRVWAALTISTRDIEEIEIALSQSRTYAILHQKPDFFGEFIMFKKLLEHIPHQEGFHIEEIL